MTPRSSSSPRRPSPGRVKTRLTPPCTPDAGRAARPRPRCPTRSPPSRAHARAGRRVCVLDGEPGAWLPDGLRGRSPSAATASTSGSPRAFADAGEPRAARRHGHAAGHARRCSTRAAPRSQRRDAVLGAAPDGGYWAHRPARRPTRACFAGVPMSADRHRRRASARGCVALGLRTAALPAAARRRHDRRRPRRRRAGARRRASPRAARRARMTPRGRAPDAAALTPSGSRTGARSPRDPAAPACAVELGARLAAAARALARPRRPRRRGLRRAPPGRCSTSAAAPAATSRALARPRRRRARHRRSPPPPSALARDARRRACCTAPSSTPSRARAAGATALLLDGNIGIGGDPGALLRRVADLLTPGGAVLVRGRRARRRRRAPVRVRLEARGRRLALVPLGAGRRRRASTRVARPAGLTTAAPLDGRRALVRRARGGLSASCPRDRRRARRDRRSGAARCAAPG